jgi:hypothetical protein
MFISAADTSHKRQVPVPEPVEAEGAVGIGVIGLALVGGLVAALVILDLTTIHRHFM